MVSTVVVLGRRTVSLMGTKTPVLASLPLLIVAICLMRISRSIYGVIDLISLTPTLR